MNVIVSDKLMSAITKDAAKHKKTVAATIRAILCGKLGLKEIDGSPSTHEKRSAAAHTAATERWRKRREGKFKPTPWNG